MLFKLVLKTSGSSLSSLVIGCVCSYRRKPWVEQEYWTWVAVLFSFHSSGGCSLPGTSPTRHQATMHSLPNYPSCFCSAMLLIPFLRARLQKHCSGYSTALVLQHAVCDKKAVPQARGALHEACWATWGQPAFLGSSGAMWIWGHLCHLTLGPRAVLVSFYQRRHSHCVHAVLLRSLHGCIQKAPSCYCPLLTLVYLVLQQFQIVYSLHCLPRKFQ